MPSGVYKRTEETKQKIRNTLLGVRHTDERKNNISIATKGIKKPWLSILKTGTKLPTKTVEKMKGRIPWNKGLPGISGKNHYNWKGGITEERVKAYSSPIYKEWRGSVFSRDKYRCQWCGQLRGDIEADHIKAYSLFPKHRFVLKNGRTLCKKCHIKRTSIQLKIMWKNQYSFKNWLNN